MKQETINIIKSMTEQGFLVIVDPEKLKGDEAVVIEVMNWKEGGNGVEISSPADDVEINVKISELAGFKKEESKPEIGLLQCDGRRFRAKIEGVECEGVVSVEGRELFLCQDKECGAEADNKKGFKFSWRVHPPFTADGFENYDVTDFELLPEHRVIFTNCVGEVFTEEDVRTDLKVWWAETRFDSGIVETNCTEISKLDEDEFAKGAETTDIFRSKKSLLKYLYETCD